jgi:inhibitor-of-growth protein 1
MYSQQAAVEAVYSTTYVEDYLDALVDLPDDLQKHLSRLREYDAECNRKFCEGKAYPA